jgi:hypothetical protein
VKVYLIAGLSGVEKTELADALRDELQDRDAPAFICVTSSLDAPAQEWNRANIPDYVEVVLGDASGLRHEPHFAFGGDGALSTEAMVSFIVGFGDGAFG